MPLSVHHHASLRARRFDHYYGTLTGVRGFNDRAVHPLKNGLPAFYQPTDAKNFSDYQLPFPVNITTEAAICMPAPTMEYFHDIAIFDGGRLDAWNTARDMGLGPAYFTRYDLPYYYALLDGFTVADQYFQSTFTCTNPNRMHLFTGTTGLSVNKSSPVVDNTEPSGGCVVAVARHGTARRASSRRRQCSSAAVDTIRSLILHLHARILNLPTLLPSTHLAAHYSYDWMTLGEVLQDAGVSWMVLQETDNFDDNANGERNGGALFDRQPAADACGDCPHPHRSLTHPSDNSHPPLLCCSLVRAVQEGQAGQPAARPGHGLRERHCGLAGVDAGQRHAAAGDHHRGAGGAVGARHVAPQ